MESLFPAPKTTCKLLDRLKVSCPTCGTGVERGILTDHVEKCMTPCTYGCGMKVLPKNLTQHFEDCLSFPVLCNAKDVGCTWTGARGGLMGHTKSCTYISIYLKKLESENTSLKAQVKNLENVVTSLSNNVYRRVDRKDIVLDCSTAAMEKFKVQTHRRVITPKGAGTVIGVDKEGYLWFLLDKDPGLSYWDDIVDYNSMIGKGIIPK